MRGRLPDGGPARRHRARPALLCPCTAWRPVEAVAAIEARTGKPVVTSNQSTIWTALRALGITRPITGFGRLLENLTPARSAPAAR